MDPRPILVAVDGSRCSIAAVKVAAELATARKTKLTVLHVLTGRGTAEAERLSLYGALRGQDPDDYALEEGRRLADQARKAAHAENAELRVEVGLAAPTIVKEAAALKAQTIVLGTHGRGWIGALALGSVSREVMSATRLQVIAVHAPDPER